MSTVRYGTVRYGTVRYGTVRYGHLAGTVHPYFLHMQTRSRKNHESKTLITTGRLKNVQSAIRNFNLTKIQNTAN